MENSQDEAIESLLSRLADLGQIAERERMEYEAINDAWWNSLSEQERQDAFYAVCKRIHKGDIVDRGSYRYVIYNVFGFGPEMYVPGLDCGYMAIHNAICEGEKANEHD